MRDYVYQRPLVLGLLLCLATASLLLTSMLAGSNGLDDWHGLGTLFGLAPTEADSGMLAQIVWQIRMPRSLGAWLAGALLGLAGALSQAVFRNPLADPYLLGSASGASLGVCLALVGLDGSLIDIHWLARLGLTGAAFAGAMLAVVMTAALASGVAQTLRLLLAGVVVAVVLGAATSLLLQMYPHLLQSMQGFMLGSTAFVGWDSCALMLAALLPGLALAMVLGRWLDGLALGEQTAASLGLPVRPMRWVLIITLALATGAAVAHTGLIAFVGLAAPHITRRMVRWGSRHGVLLASLMGGLLLVAADLLARLLIAPRELPVGVFTALIGGAYLLWLMRRHQQSGGMS